MLRDRLRTRGPQRVHALRRALVPPMAPVRRRERVRQKGHSVPKEPFLQRVLVPPKEPALQRELYPEEPAALSRQSQRRDE